MGKKFQIVSDGSCDLSPELAMKNQIEIVPFYVSFQEGVYEREGIDIGIRDFYQRMVDEPNVFPKSSMPTPQDYYDCFLKAAKSGKDVLCLCITAKFSGSVQSALNAKEMIHQEYPDMKIEVLDTTLITVSQGIVALEAARLQREGFGLEETESRIKAILDTGRIFFTVGDMEYLRHGGRIGKVAQVAGSLLDIKPIITFEQGEIFPSGVARGRKKSKRKVQEALVEHLKAKNANLSDYEIAIGFGYDKEEAEMFLQETCELLEKNGYPNAQISVRQIGATISVHTGPYPIGFGIVKKA
ncbi:MAG: DegV family protein [Lachnospiraceae bacterium]